MMDATIVRLGRMSAVGCLFAGLLAGCNGIGDNAAGVGDMTGTAILALTGVPDDGTCVEVTAAGYRTVTRDFGAAAGSDAMFTLRGLPLGQVTFTAQAFAGACPPAPGAVPTWVSDAAFTATISVSPPALVTLNLVRNGNAVVSIGFDDNAQADGGATVDDGGASGGGSAGASGGGGGASTFMKVTGVDGASTVKGFEKWFDLDSFTLGLKTAVAAAGAGGGAAAGKTAWTATATLRYQTGVPTLYADAAAGKHLTQVEIDTQKAGAMPFVYWKATLKDVLISSIAQSNGGNGNALPELTVTFVFAQVQIEYDPRNADGSAGAAVVVNWNIATNLGGTTQAVPLQFAYRGTAPMGFEPISAFMAPSETVATTTVGAGAGTGAGKPSFGDASATLAVDANALTMILEEASGRVIPTGTVQILGNTVTGMPTVIGTYGFQNLLIDGLTLTGLDATVSWTSAKLSWSFGTEMGTSP